MHAQHKKRRKYKKYKISTQGQGQGQAKDQAIYKQCLLGTEVE